MFYPIHTANLNAIKAMGCSDMFLKLELAKKVFGIGLLFCTMQYGVMIMAYSLLFASVVNQIINSWPNRKLLNYTYFEQIRDILPSVVLAVSMGIAVFFIGKISLPMTILLVIQILLGIIIYTVGSAILKLDEYVYIKNVLMGFIKK